MSLVYAYLCTLHLHALLFALFIIVTALLGVIFSIMLTTLYTHDRLHLAFLAFGSSMNSFLGGLRGLACFAFALAAFGKF